MSSIDRNQLFPSMRNIFDLSEDQLLNRVFSTSSHNCLNIDCLLFLFLILNGKQGRCYTQNCLSCIVWLDAVTVEVAYIQ